MRADAVVVVPLNEELSSHGRLMAAVNVYRIEAEDSERTEPAQRAQRRRWLQRPGQLAPAKARPKTVWNGMMDMDDIATVIGRPIPNWLEGTDASANAGQVMSYTFTTADTTSGWPVTQERLIRAQEAGMPGQFPALAVDAGDELGVVREAHAAVADNGAGWYLVCRPARPGPPVELEQLIRATLASDTALVSKELAELRELEGELDHRDPRGDVYAHAIELLAQQLRAAARDAGATRDWGDYVAGADDGWLIYSAPWDGPVVAAWRANAKEPSSLQVTATWTDETVLAADDPEPGAVTLLALTPDPDGHTRTDPGTAAPTPRPRGLRLRLHRRHPHHHLPRPAQDRARRRRSHQHHPRLAAHRTRHRPTGEPASRCGVRAHERAGCCGCPRW